MDQRRVWIAISLLLLVVVGLTWILNRGYGQVGERGYEIATSLYSVCNRQDIARLAIVEELIAESSSAGALSPQEARWFRGIIANAKSGDWERAAASIRRLMDDQISPANRLPKLD